VRNLDEPLIGSYRLNHLERESTDTDDLLHRRRRSRGNDARVLTARAGVDVIVLEKHADFLRDFRGDTIHPSTLEVIYELGLLEEFLKRPHQEIREFAGKLATS
jgi:hypothetical protein